MSAQAAAAGTGASTPIEAPPLETTTAESRDSATPSVPPGPAPAVAPPPPTPVALSGIEIEVGTSFVPALQRFVDATSAGLRGLCVVRESPERVRAYVGSRPVEIVWLTNFGRANTLKPGDLDGLSGFLGRAATEQGVSVFFLEGVEYLVRLHGLDKVLDHLAAFDERLRATEGRAWVYLNPQLARPAEIERLTARFSARTGAGGQPPPTIG